MGEVLTAQSDDNLGRMALIEAVRANTDAVSRMAQDMRSVGTKLDDVNNSIHGLDKRMALIENNTVERDLERLRQHYHSLEKKIDDCDSAMDGRVGLLEAAAERRVGAIGLVEWFGKNWAAVVAIVGFLAYLVVIRP
jgi:hypothetical protein